MVQHVVIVGGGLAGLACAVALGDAGLRVTLLEREKCLGGRARSWIDAASGDTIDLGPHLLHSEYRNMLAFLERLGTRERVLWQPEKLITFSSGAVLRHRRLPPPLSLLPDFVYGAGLSLRDLWSNNRVTWRAMRFDEADVPALDALSALDFLRAAGVSEPMIRGYWSFAALSVMNVPLERCSAAALLRVHAQLIGHRRLHFGFPAFALSELFVPQAARAIERAGGRVLLGAEAVHTSGGVILTDGTPIAADHVVLAVPPRELEPSPYISSYLWFDRKLTTERFWALRGALERLNTDFYDLSNIRRGWAGRPSVIASNIIYCHRAQGMSDGDIVTATRREIAEFVPEAAHARLVHAVVNRTPMAIPCPLPGSESARPAAYLSTSVALAGDWTRTALPCSMESAVRSGFMAAEEVLRAAGRPKHLAIEPQPPAGITGMVNRLSWLGARRRAVRAPAWRTPPTARPRPHP